MNPYSYSDKYISEIEFGFALPSFTIGVAVLALPSGVAAVTSYSDGWISILLGGIIFTLFALLAARVAQYFPGQSFFSYTSYLVTRPVAIMITIIYVLINIFLGAYITRSIAFISQQYLFDKTPMEVLSLCFLLVVIYAISGERVGLFRLNVLFLPIILSIFVFVVFFNVQLFETKNFLPLFKTDVQGYLKGIFKTFEGYTGFGIGIFYIFLIRKPKNLPKTVITGMGVSILFYLFIFLASIGVFGNLVTSNLEFPTIELAKRVDIPGGIFERIDAFIFTIWIMAIFNTVAMLLDIALLLLCSLFKNANKRIIAFILSPIIFYVAMFPRQIEQVQQAATILGKFSTSFFCFVIVTLFIMAKIRGVKQCGKT